MNIYSTKNKEDKKKSSEYLTHENILYIQSLFEQFVTKGREINVQSGVYSPHPDGFMHRKNSKAACK